MKKQPKSLVRGRVIYGPIYYTYLFENKGEVAAEEASGKQYE